MNIQITDFEIRIIGNLHPPYDIVGGIEISGYELATICNMIIMDGYDKLIFKRNKPLPSESFMGVKIEVCEKCKGYGVLFDSEKIIIPVDKMSNAIEINFTNSKHICLNCLEIMKN